MSNRRKEKEGEKEGEKQVEKEKVEKKVEEKEKESSIVSISVNSRWDLVVLVFAVFVLWALISLWTTYIEFIIFEVFCLDKKNLLIYTLVLAILSAIFILALLYTRKGHIVGHGNGSLD